MTANGFYATALCLLLCCLTARAKEIVIEKGTEIAFGNNVLRGLDTMEPNAVLDQVKIVQDPAECPGGRAYVLNTKIALPTYACLEPLPEGRNKSGNATETGKKAVTKPGIQTGVIRYCSQYGKALYHVSTGSLMTFNASESVCRLQGMSLPSMIVAPCVTQLIKDVLKAKTEPWMGPSVRRTPLAWLSKKVGGERALANDLQPYRIAVTVVRMTICMTTAQNASSVTTNVRLMTAGNSIRRFFTGAGSAQAAASQQSKTAAPPTPPSSLSPCQAAQYGFRANCPSGPKCKYYSDQVKKFCTRR